MKSRSKTLVIILLASAVIVAAFCGLYNMHGKNRDASVETPADSPETVRPLLNQSVSNDSFEAEPRIDRRVRAYMTKWDIKGASLAVSRNDTLIYAKGYGKADEGVEMTPGHIMRVASVSKLISAAAVMKMQEEGLLSLQDTVFGDRGILNDEIYNRGIGQKTGFRSITVEHLLRHQAGFRRDPMFGVGVLMQETRSTEPLTHDQTVALGLSGRLRFAPGSARR